MKGEKHGTKKQCPRCGTNFITRSHNQIRCTPQCTKDYWEENKIENEYYKRRFEILERDGFKCQYCGANPRRNKRVKLHVDHIFPRNNGGIDDKNNLITACEACNLGKGHTFYPQIFNKIT